MTLRTILLLVVVGLIGAAIVYLESLKASEAPVSSDGPAEQGEPYKEITNPSGFINTEPFQFADYIGERVILVDFWTYSCINCQRTTPYLNAWWEAYEDDGLLIVGIHTPEFKFEEDYANVQAAVEKFGIKFPVVLDNDKGTWGAYGNRYWPRKYLIDLEGNVVYDHIGEGAYEETETKIRELLGVEDQSEVGEVKDVDFAQIDSPEVYFGADRNKFLANGIQDLVGVQSLIAPNSNLWESNKLYLSGSWDIQNEYAQSVDQGSAGFQYKAKEVYMVASSEAATEVEVWVDGVFVRTILVQDEQLYTLVEAEDYGEHVLELKVKGQLRLFTLTFG